MSGRILVGDHAGVYVIRFEGDVRVTLCGSFDHYLDVMLQDPGFVSVLVDLSDAIAIDSTSLGVLAKLSLGVQDSKARLPTLVCNVPRASPGLRARKPKPTSLPNSLCFTPAKRLASRSRLSRTRE